MLGVKQDKDILGAYCFFWVVSILLTLLVACTKDASTLNSFKFFTVIAYGLYGGIALETFDILRRSDGLDYPGLTNFALGQAFHGIFGIFLFFWSLFSFLFSDRINSVAPDKKLTAASGFRSRTFFYIVAIELTFVGMIITATALSYSHVPLGYAGCRWNRLGGTDLETISHIMYANVKRVCSRAVTTQILAIMTAILAIFQSVIFIPVIAYPRIVRYVLYLVFHKAPPRHKVSLLREKGPEAYDLEQLMPAKLLSESPRLHEVFADDTIAEKIARHLHFVDITNLSRASQAQQLIELQTNCRRVDESSAQQSAVGTFSAIVAK